MHPVYDIAAVFVPTSEELLSTLLTRCCLRLQDTKKDIKRILKELEKQGELHNELIEQNKILIEEFKEIKDKVTIGSDIAIYKTSV